MRSVVCALVLALAACGAPQQEAPADDEASATLRIEDAWASPTPGGVEVSAGYLSIVNGTAGEDRLVLASSPRASRVELHEMAMDGDVMQMRPVEGLVVPAGETIALAPGSAHLMFYGVTQPFVQGEEIPVRLVFENAGEMNIALPVRRQGAQSHSAGH